MIWGGTGESLFFFFFQTFLLHGMCIGYSYIKEIIIAVRLLVRPEPSSIVICPRGSLTPLVRTCSAAASPTRRRAPHRHRPCCALSAGGYSPRRHRDSARRRSDQSALSFSRRRRHIGRCVPDGVRPAACPPSRHCPGLRSRSSTAPAPPFLLNHRLG